MKSGEEWRRSGEWVLDGGVEEEEKKKEKTERMSRVRVLRSICAKNLKWKKDYKCTNSPMK
jgi:hypothetical protein